MNFKNKNNVGNTTFIPMNKYMLSTGLNDNQVSQRLVLNNSLIFSNLNNINQRFSRFFQPFHLKISNFKY